MMTSEESGLGGKAGSGRKTTGNSPGDNFPGGKPLIEPTPGRIVWFYECQDIYGGKKIEGPFAAIVTGVVSPRTINICAFTYTGQPLARQGVYLLQEDDEPPVGRSYATWMPYQLGQQRSRSA